MPKIKICCISSLDEARLAISHGASALGFVSEMPSGPGVISEDLIAEIVPWIPPPIATFLLTSSTRAEVIISQQRYTRVNTLQLVDRLATIELRELRRALPGVGLVQVIHVTGRESVGEAIAVAPDVDAILLDSGNQLLPIKELGGTGRTHDWQLSRQIRESVGVSIFLAGGLKAGNVADAIRMVEPFGVDVCGGVRTDGKLDQSKLAGFIEAVRIS